MKRLIKEIVDTDRASRAEVDKAVKRREMLSDEINNKAEEIDAGLKAEADKTVEEARKSAQAEIDKIKTELHEYNIKKGNELNKNFDENHDKWEKEMLKEILG